MKYFCLNLIRNAFGNGFRESVVEKLKIVLNKRLKKRTLTKQFFLITVWDFRILNFNFIEKFFKQP